MRNPNEIRPHPTLPRLAAASGRSHVDSPSPAIAGTLRIVDWNIEDDINGATTPLPGFNTVLQGIGIATIGSDPAQPIDIMTIEETTSNTTTVQPILNMLNGDYAGANYQMSSYQATQSGGNTDGNGPNAVVYNANAVNLLASVGVGTPQGSTNGEYRQVVRYEFQPVADTGTGRHLLCLCQPHEIGHVRLRCHRPRQRGDHHPQ